ncbi:MAG: hypothetical protein HQK55_05425 [Deltaproteobacteria bacterium]|nr:hypothetical protein [Deltaproteobacteria bacterium]
MKIEFSPPFKDEMGADELSLPLKTAVSLARVIALIAQHREYFQKYVVIHDDSLLSANLMFIRNGRVLLLSDLVEDNDVLGVFLPAIGG